ncbi:MAG TPA: four helix bundle protein [Chryseosolibacter sp.]
MNKEELARRTRRFAVGVFKLTTKFPRTESARVVIYQLLKAASSVAANYRAVLRAKSKADFIHKLKVVLEEADESNFWLTFVADIELIRIDDKELNILIKESTELIAIFTASLNTLTKPKF